MKAGRTFVTNGPMVELTVEKAMPGEEVKANWNANLRIHARAWAPPSIGSPKKLEIVAHGEVIHSTESSDADEQELRIDAVMKAGTSKWVAARVTSHNGALAHTSPIYVMVGGRSFRNRKQTARLVEQRLQILDFITSRLHDPQFVSNDDYKADEIEALTSEISEARSHYRQLLAES
jgi:hypothetical protein